MQPLAGRGQDKQSSTLLYFCTSATQKCFLISSSSSPQLFSESFNPGVAQASSLKAGLRRRGVGITLGLGQSLTPSCDFSAAQKALFERAVN